MQFIIIIFLICNKVPWDRPLHLYCETLMTRPALKINSHPMINIPKPPEKALCTSPCSSGSLFLILQEPYVCQIKQRSAGLFTQSANKYHEVHVIFLSYKSLRQGSDSCAAVEVLSTNCWEHSGV